MIINLKIQRQGQGQDSNDKDEIQLSKTWNLHNRNERVTSNWDSAKYVELKPDAPVSWNTTTLVVS